MNGNESNQKLNVRELTEEIERATNLVAETAENGQKTVVQSENGLEGVNRANLAVEQGQNDEKMTNGQFLMGEQNGAGLGNDRNAAGWGREQVRAFGSAMLSGNVGSEVRNVSAESVGNVGSETERALNAERVEQMVTAENVAGEEQRLATTKPTVPEALIMPQIQGKIDKTIAKMLGELTNREGDRPGMLDAKVNDLRRQYRVGWETNQ